ncbi:MAG TPA: glucose-6-phosphate dehydrogenase assembly protein OpcA [Candidatus Eisenbacteria bacterium]
MWKSASSEHGTVYRAATSNLIVPIDAPLRDRIAPVLTEVTRRNPSRLVQIERSERESPDSRRLFARTTALCHLRPGGGLVCSEQIVVRWSARSCSLVPSAVQALLVGDLPVVILAIEPGPRAQWLAAFEGIADLRIADSATESEPAAMARLWTDLPGPRRTALHDLAWARLGAWRALLAEAFERPEAAEVPPAIQEVTIAHGGPAPPAGAWLLAGWLASRLGWTPKGAARGHVRLAGPTRPVTIAFVRDEEETRHLIRRVRIRSGAPRPFDLSVEHRGHDPVARIEAAAPVHASREATFAYRDLAGSIVGEIHRHEPNRTFEDAARVAKEMIALWPAP